MCYCPTPTLHLNLALTGDWAHLLSPKNSHCMIYKRFELWGHWKCPHSSPSPCNTRHTHAITQMCVLINHTRTHRRTHTRTRTHTHTHTHAHTHARTRTRTRTRTCTDAHTHTHTPVERLGLTAVLLCGQLQEFGQTLSDRKYRREHRKCHLHTSEQNAPAGPRSELCQTEEMNTSTSCQKSLAPAFCPSRWKWCSRHSRILLTCSEYCRVLVCGCYVVLSVLECCYAVSSLFWMLLGYFEYFLQCGYAVSVLFWVCYSVAIQL